MSPQTVYDFETGGDLTRWRMVDDGVMGGRSAGTFSLNEDGHAVFAGYVSLENNGGFSSVRYAPGTMHVEDADRFVLRVKGDGKRYQFRVKPEANDRHSYVAYFRAGESWQEVEIPFSAFQPQFRGRSLNLPDFTGPTFEEIGLLIGNGRAEAFELHIDRIKLR